MMQNRLIIPQNNIAVFDNRCAEIEIDVIYKHSLVKAADLPPDLQPYKRRRGVAALHRFIRRRAFGGHYLRLVVVNIPRSYNRDLRNIGIPAEFFDNIRLGKRVLVESKQPFKAVALRRLAHLIESARNPGIFAVFNKNNPLVLTDSRLELSEVRGGVINNIKPFNLL